MNMGQTQIFQGKTIQILEMVLKNTNDQLELSWKISFENEIFRIIFHNVSKFNAENLSAPLEVHGFEILNHSQDGWEKDSRYEIHDFEDGCIHFFCECFEMNESEAN